MEPHECFELLSHLYGLVDANDLWHAKIDKHLTEDLKIEISMSDLSPYLYCDGGQLIDINTTYVDDLLRCGTESLREKRNSLMINSRS